MDSSQADISYQQGWVHILILAWALMGPILSGKHRNKDTGHQEAIPVGERGRGPLFQDQLWAALHHLNRRQTGREQRGQEQTFK